MKSMDPADMMEQKRPKKPAQKIKAKSAAKKARKPVSKKGMNSGRGAEAKYKEEEKVAGSEAAEEPKDLDGSDRPKGEVQVEPIRFIITDDPAIVSENFLTILWYDFSNLSLGSTHQTTILGFDISASELRSVGATPESRFIFIPERSLLLLGLVDDDDLALEAMLSSIVGPIDQSAVPDKIIIDDFCFGPETSDAKDLPRLTALVDRMRRFITLLVKNRIFAHRRSIPVMYRLHANPSTNIETINNYAKSFRRFGESKFRFPFLVDVETATPPEEAFTARTNFDHDQPSTNDYLGFKPLARSLAAFVKHRDTQLPLSIAIDGPWGTGKSSLMMMVREELSAGFQKLDAERKHPGLMRSMWQGLQISYFTLEPLVLLMAGTLLTYGALKANAVPTWLWNETNVFPAVWATALTYLLICAGHWLYNRNRNSERHRSDAPREFESVFVNAWRHGHGTRLKAAIMKRIIGQLIAKRGGRFFLKLQLARFNRLSFLKTAFQSAFQNSLFVAILFLVGVAVLFTGIDLSVFGEPKILDGALLLGAPKWVVGPLLSASAVALKISKKTQTAKLKDFLTSPDYEKLAGPDDEIEEDFGRIVHLLKQEGRALAIFIDDLDRCSPETVHQVVEALNVFFGKHDSECLFVLGMHKEMVACSLEVAYEKMATKLDNNPLLAEQRPYGRRFLEKIVQFVVPVPSPKNSDIVGYIEQLTKGSDLQKVKELVEQQYKLQQRQNLPQQWQSITRFFRFYRQRINRPIAAIWYHVEALFNGRPPPEAPPSLKAVEEQINQLEQNDIYLKSQLEEARAAFEQEEKRLADAASFKPTDTHVAAIFTEIKPALRANPRQYKRFFNQFRFNRFVSESLGDLDKNIAEKHDAIIAAISLEYPLLYQWVFEGLEAEDGQRHIEAALFRIVKLCENGKQVKDPLSPTADKEERILHTYQNDTALKGLVDKVTV